MFANVPNCFVAPDMDGDLLDLQIFDFDGCIIQTQGSVAGTFSILLHLEVTPCMLTSCKYLLRDPMQMIVLYSVAIARKHLDRILISLKPIQKRFGKGSVQ